MNEDKIPMHIKDVFKVFNVNYSRRWLVRLFQII